MMGLFLRNFFIACVLALCGAGMSSFAQAACLPGLPCLTPDDSAAEPVILSHAGDPACDAKFMNQIYARAFQEADREIALGGATVRKPDSVLELGCYGRLAALAADSSAVFFSANGDSPGGTVQSSSYGVRIAPLVEAYVDEGFGYGWFARDANGVPLADQTCANIQAVQQLARCGHVGEGGPLFYSFKDLVDADPRVMRSGQACVSDHWSQVRLDVAGNAGREFVPFPDAGKFVERAHAVACGDPVDTGMVLKDVPVDMGVSQRGQGYVKTSQDRAHKVCLTQGCVYDFKQDACVQE